MGVTETFMELYEKQVLTLFPGRQIRFSQNSPVNTNLEEKANDLQKRMCFLSKQFYCFYSDQAVLTVSGMKNCYFVTAIYMARAFLVMLS